MHLKKNVMMNQSICFQYPKSNAEHKKDIKSMIIEIKYIL